jgi:hypothetical protein
VSGRSGTWHRRRMAVSSSSARRHLCDGPQDPLVPSLPRCSSLITEALRWVGKLVVWRSTQPINNSPSGNRPEAPSVLVNQTQNSETCGHFIGYLTGRDPKIRMSTSFLALCCQLEPAPTVATPTSARSRSIASRSSRMSPLLIERLTRLRTASQIRP